MNLYATSFMQHLNNHLVTCSENCLLLTCCYVIINIINYCRKPMQTLPLILFVKKKKQPNNGKEALVVGFKLQYLLFHHQAMHHIS